MPYQLYAFDAEPVLIEEFDDAEALDDVVARCEELVHEEGYARAEVWDEAGDLVHAVGRVLAGRDRAGPSGRSSAFAPPPVLGLGGHDTARGADAETDAPETSALDASSFGTSPFGAAGFDADELDESDADVVDDDDVPDEASDADEPDDRGARGDTAHGDVERGDAARETPDAAAEDLSDERTGGSGAAGGAGGWIGATSRGPVIWFGL